MSDLIKVQFKTAEEKQRMKNFLLMNIDILDKLKNNKPYEPAHENIPIDGESLAYSARKHLLGFECSGTPFYIWDLCTWMAVKSEKRDNNNNPYFYYDDTKQIVTFEENNTKGLLVNSEGIRLRKNSEINMPESVVIALLGTEQEQKNKNELLNQLNNNWNEYINVLQPLTTIKKIKP